MTDMQPWTRQVGWYMRNCLLSSKGEPLFGILEEHAEILATRMTDGEEEDEDDLPSVDSSEAATSQTARQKLSRDMRRRTLRTFLDDFAAEPGIDPVVADNLGFATEEFGLSVLDVGILKLILRYTRFSMLEEFCDAVKEELRTVPAALSALLLASETEVAERLASGGPLVDNGLIAYNRSGHGLSGPGGEIHLAPALAKGMRRAHDSREDWVSSLRGKLLVPVFAWEEYSHLGASAELARRALLGWPEEGRPGLHLFLVGPTGTGKTTFAVTLAHAAGLHAWSVGEENYESDNPEMTRAQRLAAFRLACAMVRTKRDCVLVMDEAGDVLQAPRSFGAMKGEHSKLYLNRIMDTSPVPVIWTGNDLDDMDPASVRRMTQVIAMKVPDRAARARIWTRVLEQHQLVLPAGAEQRLADRWEAAPAVAANAARIVKLAGGQEADVEVALSGAMQALGLHPRLPERDGRDFDPDLSVCDDDLEQFIRDVTGPGAERSWSACFCGLPGTGKSECASHIATRLGMETRRVHCSDLVSKWHGETGKNIAAMFADARIRNQVLIMDEVDALVFDRSGATHSWEVSEVNAMLTHMEEHPLPFIGTTNSMGHIDKAAMRRFTFWFEFRLLDEVRARLAFQRILGMEPPGPLPGNLAPDDFAKVRKQARMRSVRDPATLVQWLWKLSQAKGGLRSPIGYHAPSPLVAVASAGSRPL